MKIRKAVIAAAGFGTRFLPWTKAMPKEMLPLPDGMPIIEHIVRELVEAGIEDIAIITGYHKRSIEDHFDSLSADLQTNLNQTGKVELLKEIEEIPQLANFTYIRQKGPYGNATPLLNAEPWIGNEPFIYTFADDFIEAKPSRFQKLVEAHSQNGGSILTCIEASAEQDFQRYAYISGDKEKDGLIEVKGIIEKPGSAKESPSKIASVSGYLLEPAIFDYLKHAKKQLLQDEEFLMQPSITKMASDGHKIFGCVFPSDTFYDTGNKLGYLKTVVDFALKKERISPEFKKFLKDTLN